MTLSDVCRVLVPTACAREVETHLRKVGREGYEGIALWAGTQDGHVFQVKETLIPSQRHISNADGVCVVVDKDALHKLNVYLYKKGLTLMAQIHSHPGKAYHSDTDDAYAIATTVGSLSLVVPDFARKPFTIAACASYRLDEKARWQQLSVRKACALIVVGD